MTPCHHEVLDSLIREMDSLQSQQLRHVARIVARPGSMVARLIDVVRQWR